MIRKLFLFFALFLAGCLFQGTYAVAQGKYWVFYKDKQGVEFDPYAYFDAKTISSRKEKGIPLNQYTDMPVRKSYVEEVVQVAGKPLVTSRWLNASMFRLPEGSLREIRELPFIKEVRQVAKKSLDIHYDTILEKADKELMVQQLARFGDSLFAAHKLDGSGVRIAVFDAGFPGVDENPFFRHLHQQGKIIETYDFVREETDVYGHNAHGTMVLSCIAGMNQNQRLGLATGADFLLARTERGIIEPISEEENWFQAMEWADKHGADIISSSLGYTNHRYFKQDMDGKTSLVSKAANIAASKGMLVVVSMGNEGTSSWQVMGTPADADSVLSIAAIHPSTGIHTPFSSFGLTADHRLKPNLTAYGHVIAAGRNRLTQTQGTSFSAPLVAGFAACVWQKFPQWNAVKLMEELTHSGDLYPYYDYAHGYGVPQAGYFLLPQKDSMAMKADFNIEFQQHMIRISLRNSDDLHPGAASYPYLFYHVENSKGHLLKYGVAHHKRGQVLNIRRKDSYSGGILRIFYKGYSAEKDIPTH